MNLQNWGEEMANKGEQKNVYVIDICAKGIFVLCLFPVTKHM